MTVENFIKSLPLEVAVTLSVEKVFKKDDLDNCFMLECRVADGENTGDLIRLWFYREKKAGGPRKDTTALLEVCNPGKKADKCPSYTMQAKIFQTTPWQPEGSKYPMYGNFKYIGENDYKDNTFQSPGLKEDAPPVAAQKPILDLNDIPF